MNKKRGLGSLIPTERWLPKEEGPRGVAVERIDRNRYQPRQRWDEEKLEELAGSIRQHGVLQPLAVRTAGERFELIAGERRLEAAKRAGLKEVPVVVRECSDGELLELSLVENLQREDINPMEAAEAYERLREEFGLTQEDISERVGKSRQAVSNTLRLLELPEYMKNCVKQGSLSEGQAKVLLSIEEEQLRKVVWQTTMKRGLSVRQMERMVRRAQIAPRGAKLTKVNFQTQMFLQPLVDNLTRKLGTKVSIVHGEPGGRIEVTYANQGELERIYNQIMG
jgi:ParB family chromosome partitioning protein